MLASVFGEHHIAGGIYFMAPLTVLLVMSTILLAFILIKKNLDSLWSEIYKHVGLVIFAYGIFGTLVGFLFMFDALESIKEDLPRQVIAGGVKVALLPVLYGTLYFCIIQAIYLAMRVLKATRAAT